MSRLPLCTILTAVLCASCGASPLRTLAVEPCASGHDAADLFELLERDTVVTLEAAIVLRDRSGCAARPVGSRVELPLWVIPRGTGSHGYPMRLAGEIGGRALACQVTCVDEGEPRGDPDTLDCAVPPGTYRVTGTVHPRGIDAPALHATELCSAPARPDSTRSEEKLSRRRRGDRAGAVGAPRRP